MDQPMSHGERKWPALEGSGVNAVQPEGAGSSFKIVNVGAVDIPSEEWSEQNVRIGWIDSFALTRDCILKVLSATQPRLVIRPFSSAAELLEVASENFDVVVLHSHDSYETCLQDITMLREAAPALPVVILSDLEESCQVNVVRGALRAGASGFISTRSMGLGMTLSAIRFVQSGGTFAPVDLLLSEPVPAAAPPEDNEYRLTTRQRDVLAQLQQGKANKIIAHELGMSESTAKVHIRNIMRKMGATNRTQAAFNALKLYPVNEHRSLL